MSSWVLNQENAGSRLCLMIGRVSAEACTEILGRYERVGWFVDREGALSVPASDRLDPWLLESLQTEDVVPTLEQFLMQDFEALPDLKIAASVMEQDSDAYNFIVGEIQPVFDRTLRSRLTREEEGDVWQEHLLKNMPAYIDRRVPDSWSGALAGLPAVVVGAGPSLDVTAPLLHERITGKAVVIAADSAVRTLAKHGVNPDFVVSVDAAKFPERCLSPEGRVSRVVCSSISPHAWTVDTRIDGLWFLSGNNLTEDWLEERFEVRKTTLCVQDNCGTTAILLARFLGAGSIYLAGMDMAADAANPGMRHAGDAADGISRGAHFGEGGELPSVPGNFVDEVPTFLYSEWKSLNELLAGFRNEIPVFNINDRGAKLEAALIEPSSLRMDVEINEQLHEGLMLLDSAISGGTDIRAIRSQMAESVQRGIKLLTAAEAAVDKGQFDEGLRLFRSVFADDELPRLLGSVSLKMMPHLVGRAPVDAEWLRDAVRRCHQVVVLAGSIFGN